MPSLIQDGYPTTQGNEPSPNQYQALDNERTSIGLDDQNQNVRTVVETENSVLESEQLPDFIPVQPASFKWGEIEGEAFCQDIQECYNQIVHWRRNLFKVPSGQAGKSFVRGLTRMFQSYADASALETVALQAAMVMPALLLQKPHAKSKAKEHNVHLNRRLKQWMNGDINGLL